jgi:hypothetical protein
MAKKRGKKLAAGKSIREQKPLTNPIGVPIKGGSIPIPRLASNHNEVVLRA